MPFRRMGHTLAPERQSISCDAEVATLATVWLSIVKAPSRRRRAFLLLTNALESGKHEVGEKYFETDLLHCANDRFRAQNEKHDDSK